MIFLNLPRQIFLRPVENNLDVEDFEISKDLAMRLVLIVMELMIIEKVKQSPFGHVSILCGLNEQNSNMIVGKIARS